MDLNTEPNFASKSNKESEFSQIQKLPDGKLTLESIKTIESSNEKLQNIIASSQNTAKNSEIGKITQYRRAGKSFVRIDHKLEEDDAKILEEFLRESIQKDERVNGSYETISRDSMCFVCR